MPDAPTILDLIRNGTLSTEMAATLWAAVDQRWSFVATAIPRLAGKTAVMNAMLALLPPTVSVHRLSGDVAQMAHLQEAATGGYLVVGEFSQAPVPTYIWGAPVRRVFDTLTTGYSLATALHAPSLQATFDTICNGNGVTDEQASHIRLVLHLRRFGERPGNFWRRLAQVHEVERVEGGHPIARLLHRWLEEADSFEAVDASRLLPADTADLAGRSTHLRSLVEAGRTMAADVAQMVAESHTRG